MKRLISIMLSLALMMSVCFIGSAGVYAENSDSEFEYTLNSDSNATLTDYKGNEVNLKIPESVDGHSVTAIDGNSFYNKAFIDRNNHSHYGCVITIKIPETVKSISNLSGFFSVFTSLFSISVDASNPSYKSVKGVLFDKKGETLLCYPQMRMDEYYIVPSGVKTISNRAFYNVYYLNNVKIRSGVTKIGARAFYNCPRITEIVIPKTVKSIGSEALGYYEYYLSSYYDQTDNIYTDVESYSMPLRGFVVYGYKGTAAEKYCNNTKIKNAYGANNNYGKVKFAQPKFKKPSINAKRGKNYITVKLSNYNYLEMYEVVVYRGKKKICESNGTARKYKIGKLSKGTYTVKARGIITISGYRFKTPWGSKTVTIK